MLGNLHAFEEIHLASFETEPVPLTVLWRARLSLHPTTPSISSATLSIIVESSDKELGQEVLILEQDRSGNLSTFSVAAS